MANCLNIEDNYYIIEKQASFKQAEEFKPAS
jgi:hypothetical protein